MYCHFDLTEYRRHPVAGELAPQMNNGKNNSNPMLIRLSAQANDVARNEPPRVFLVDQVGTSDH